MKWIGGRATQTGNDAKTRIEIPTSLGIIDQRTIWSIHGFEAIWYNYGITNTNSFWLDAVLSAIDDDVNFGDNADICRVSWTIAVYQGAASGTAEKIPVVLPRRQRDQLFVPFDFANSKLFLTLLSGVTGQPNAVDWKLFYEEKKVSELEYLKVQAGYCIC